MLSLLGILCWQIQGVYGAQVTCVNGTVAETCYYCCGPAGRRDCCSFEESDSYDTFKYIYYIAPVIVVIVLVVIGIRCYFRHRRKRDRLAPQVLYQGPNYINGQQGQPPPSRNQQGPNYMSGQQGQPPPSWNQQGPNYMSGEQGKPPPSWNQQGTTDATNHQGQPPPYSYQ